MSKKVFELAKELDVGSVDLVEQLRGLGFDIKNHMVKLTDEQLSLAMDKLGKGPEVAEASTVKKKKVVKKKTTKKKAVKKTSTKTTDDKEKKVVKKKVVTVRKKKVIKKAAPAKVQEVETITKPTKDISSTDVEVKASEEVKTAEANSNQVETTGAQNSMHSFTPISAAPKEKEEVIVKEEVVETTKKKMFKEKMHTFTPIYVPEKKAESKTEAKPAGASTPGESTESADFKNKSKKRIGDLAAIVNKKGGEKSKDLGMLRAEEELKLASNLVGNNVYIPARRKKNYIGETKKTILTEVKDSKRVIKFNGSIKAKDLANQLSQKFKSFIDQCLDLNLLVKEDDQIGVILASEIAAMYDFRVENVAFDEQEVINKVQDQTDKSDLPLRNPIITVMGHVDHGKTTLLDYIRKEKVAADEAGGITQHIGAYSVKVKDATLTFLDTPGHSAFGAMRQRGANVTDIVILVVAADDGVMPQTKESIKFIQNADVPMIVAVNKMDKEGANPDRIKQDLMEFGITPEEWGGDVQFVEVSALKGDGIDNLLESIQLQAEMMELRESDKGGAEGVIIESRVESGRGPVCTVLVQKGTLKKGDAVVVGESAGRARSLMDSSGKMLQKAGPSTPIQILGLGGVATPGDILNVVKNEREAKKIAANRVEERKSLEVASKKKMSLEDFFGTDSSEGEKKTLSLIVRSDVIGSFEAIKNSLEKLGNNEVGVKVVSGGAGAISDSDVMMAESTEGYIIGFNMRPVTSARRLAEQKGIDIKTYSIIYELIDDIKLALEGMLEPESIEVYIGRAQVKETFMIPKIGMIAGSSVIDGKIAKGCNIRLLRNGKIMHDGKLSSLKRFKDDVKEVKNGYECGIALEGYDDVKAEDLFEAYIMEEKKRTLEDVQV